MYVNLLGLVIWRALGGFWTWCRKASAERCVAIGRATAATSLGFMVQDAHTPLARGATTRVWANHGAIGGWMTQLGPQGALAWDRPK